MGYCAAFPFIQPESLSLDGKMPKSLRFRGLGFEGAFRWRGTPAGMFFKKVPNGCEGSMGIGSRGSLKPSPESNIPSGFNEQSDGQNVVSVCNIQL